MNEDNVTPQTPPTPEGWVPGNLAEPETVAEALEGSDTTPEEVVEVVEEAAPEAAAE